MTLSRNLLTADEQTAALASLPGWRIIHDKLYKQYKFASFAAALGWMVSVGLAAERMDHHPEWTNVYNKVTVHLTTHDRGGITAWDVALAQVMEQFATQVYQS